MENNDVLLLYSLYLISLMRLHVLTGLCVDNLSRTYLFTDPVPEMFFIQEPCTGYEQRKAGKVGEYAGSEQQYGTDEYKHAVEQGISGHPAVGHLTLDAVQYTQSLVFCKCGPGYACDDDDSQGWHDSQTDSHLDEYVELYEGYGYEEEQEGCEHGCGSFGIGVLLPVRCLFVVQG
jgi:hypothetical protein